MKEIVFQNPCANMYARSICMGNLKAETFHITTNLTLMLPNLPENGNCSTTLFSCTFLLSLVHHVNDPENSGFSKTTYNG